MYSFELLAYKTLVNPDAMPYSTEAASQLPDYFISADDISPKAHVDIQAASQKWIDSSISKTANVPTDYPYEDFKDIYMYAHKQGLKGCTTFRFNPAGSWRDRQRGGAVRRAQGGVLREILMAGGARQAGPDGIVGCVFHSLAIL